MSKAKGTRAEHRSRRLLEAQGYRVTRAAASLGCWDLVAFSSADVVLVQVKANRWPGSVELAAMQAFPCPPGARKVIHRWRDFARAPDVREVA